MVSTGNFLISNPMGVTKDRTSPLLAAPVHEWPTLLTISILVQVQNFTASVLGPGRKTVISLDMGQYQPAKKVQMARNYLSNLIIRPGNCTF